MPTRRSNVLGDLAFSPTVDSWNGGVAFGGEHVSVSVDGLEDAPDALFERAEAVFAALDDAALRACAVERLYDLYERVWRQDDGPQVDAAGFAELLVPQSVTVWSDGTATVYYADGDLFWGHVVLVRVGADGVPESASIAG